jgi:hypothetical protein
LNANNSDHDQVLATWELFEQQVIRRFDSPNIDPNPSLRSLILWLHSFGVVSIMGIDPREALIRDLVIKINHKRFDTHAQVWIKIRDIARKWNKVA